MMTGKLFIDGSDAYIDYGVYIEGNSLGAFVQQPPFKKVDSTDWPDEDGEEYDLTAPVLDTRSLQVNFVITNVRYAEDFFDALGKGAYHLFHIPALGESWKLRMTSKGSFASYVTLGKLSLTFADDFPRIPQSSPADLGKSGVVQFGYKLDGIDMSRFGAYILKGSHNDLRKSPQIKTNLEIKNKNMAGVKYDAEEVHFKSKNVTLNVLIKTSSLLNFWERYDALFAILMQPDVRKFYIEETNTEYECFYLKQDVTNFSVLSNGGIWCEFALTLKFTSCEPSNSYLLLATEDNCWIITEDGANIIIRSRS